MLNPEGYTYFIQAGEHGPIKIGRAGDPKSRIDAIQTSNPETLSIRLIVLGSSNEKKFHEQFSEYRLKGEWFSPGPRLMEFIRSHPPLDEGNMPVSKSPRPPKKRVHSVSPTRSGWKNGRRKRHWDFSGKTVEQAVSEMVVVHRMIGWKFDRESIEDLVVSLGAETPTAPATYA